jgi:20S proteasome subunit beta 2
MSEEQKKLPVELLRKGGFNFANARRNEMLAKAGHKAPKEMKTGTTIAGLVFKDGVVLGADTRATEGSIVCDKNCIKIHKIADNIYCCGAGTSADTENVTCLVSSQLELLRLDTGCQPRVVTAMTRLKQRLFQYQGNISAALVLGGIDISGPHIYTVYPHGSTDKLPYATMGSGSLAAMAVFERGFKDNLDEKEAVDLVDQAIQAGIFNDLGSGSNVDICVITRDGVKFSHNYRTGPEGNVKPERRHKYNFPRGTTEVLKEVRRVFTEQISIEKTVTASSSSKAASMDTS